MKQFQLAYQTRKVTSVMILEEMVAYYKMMQGSEEWTFSCVNVLCVGRGVMSQSRYHSRYFVRYVENC